MRNLTVKISDDTYRDARVWAARRGTSISAGVLALLQSLPTNPRAARTFPEHHRPVENTHSARVTPPAS